MKTTSNSSKAMYSSPRLAALEENFEKVLCASDNVSTEQFDDLTEYEW